ncbi:MAG: hypothetical protein FJZ66_03210 [Bacteroidetes bacterium]|nr:hypothetical protein [Bacteroidota bacterium]
MREDQELTELRPLVATMPTENELEVFQNEVLRPILKYQQELWSFISRQEPFILKAITSGKSASEKWNLLMKMATKNPSLKYQWIGMVSGLLTNVEFAFYYQNKKELDKRIMGMLAQRMVDSY